jgi:ferric-dicitrate binding protein FerR (iron transport regulator)
VQQVRQQVLDEHRETVAAVIDAGAAVASEVEHRPVTDGDHLRNPLETRLRERGLAVRLLGVLTTGAGALDTGMAAEPVAGPPYLVVTSRGPLCRGTLADGRRLVVELPLFAVERRPPRYRFRDPTVEECLQVSLRDG